MGIELRYFLSIPVANNGNWRMFGPYRSHFLSKKSLIAAKNETKEERRKEEEETPLVHVNEAMLT